MRKVKTFKIEGYDHNFTVKELTVKEIMSLMDEDVLADISLEGLKKQLQDKFLPMCTEGLSLDDFVDFAPSEIKEIWDNFREVNEAFFEAARKSGLMDTLEGMKKAIVGDFSKLLAGSSNQDTPTP